MRDVFVLILRSQEAIWLTNGLVVKTVLLYFVIFLVLHVLMYI